MQLSNVHRDLLIEYIDGGLLAVNLRDWNRSRAVKSLIQAGLVEYDDHKSHTNRARYTRITLKGRETLAKLLADYADVLTRLTAIVAQKPAGYFSPNYGVEPMDSVDDSREGPVAGQGQTALAGTGEDLDVHRNGYSQR